MIVCALRRALGDGQGDNRYVVTVPGRGYNFVAPVRIEEPSRASPPATVAPAALHNLPFATTRMIGREEVVATLVHATLAPAPGDDRRARRHRQDHGRPRRRRAHDRRL